MGPPVEKIGNLGLPVLPSTPWAPNSALTLCLARTCHGAHEAGFAHAGGPHN